MKRIFDIGFAIIGLIIFSPVILIISFLIYNEDKGPIIFRQERVGRHKITFKILKFRSMGNSKVTRVGKWLRKTDLDELLQFVNVLKGEMSMVGPRPLTKSDITRLGWDKDSYSIRWDYKPGITGMAQVFGDNGSSLSWFLDKRYLIRQNFLLDIQLITLAFAMNIFGKQFVRRTLRL